MIDSPLFRHVSPRTARGAELIALAIVAGRSEAKSAPTFTAGTNAGAPSDHEAYPGYVRMHLSAHGRHVGHEDVPVDMAGMQEIQAHLDEHPLIRQDVEYTLRQWGRAEEVV